MQNFKKSVCFTVLIRKLPGVCCSGVPHLTPQSVWVCASVCGVWGDSPTALSGGDSCHQFTEGDTPSSLFFRSHDLEWGGAICQSCCLTLSCTYVMYNITSNFSLCFLVG